MDKPYLEEIVYKFTQDGNTDGTTDNYEELTVTVQASTGSIDIDGGYLVIRTPTGWSIDSSSELLDILTTVSAGVRIK
jgi:hypothetical protein